MVSETLQKIKNNGLGSATSSSIYTDGMSDGIMYKAFLIHFLPVFKLNNGPIFQYIAVFDLYAFSNLIQFCGYGTWFNINCLKSQKYQLKYKGQ